MFGDEDETRRRTNFCGIAERSYRKVEIHQAAQPIEP